MRTDDRDDYSFEEPRTTRLARKAGAVAFGTVALSIVGMATLAYGAVALARRAADGMRPITPRQPALGNALGMPAPPADVTAAPTSSFGTATPLGTRPSLPEIP